ncbi:MAG TPA: single-stranded-DNA-specific exonuclease RecJ [Bacteriovoracaceae bacterium]|nr:single-stranded-DNA-specific exonuclease RecJ [Bacteriovoracaceae bacterium]
MQTTPTATSQASLTELNSVLVRLFKKRGLSPADVQDMLSWNLKDLPDLTAMIDLPKASQRIIQAIDNGETIGVYGDYDVDGTTSCALLWQFFKFLNVTVEVFQPSRFVEGYGIHPSSIDAALEKNVKVLISVDCGISNTATADYAQGKLDLIITDHHRDAASHIPRAFAVINPCRRDEPEDSVLRTLAGVGVAFALGLQIKKDLAARGQEIPSLYPLLQFVAIGTISDLARMSPLNLRLTRHGLKQIPTSCYPGIKAFFAPEELKVDCVSSEKISFHVGPHINSKGRLDHPERAFKLLISGTPEETREHYPHLELANLERRQIQREVFEEAKKDVISSLNSDELFINILYRPHWHEGVIGIVASKLVETFEVPAIVFTNAEEDGVIKASGRSVGELNIFDLLEECKDLFIKFGGHKMACGLSMRKENFSAFRQRMVGLLKLVPAPLRTKTRSFDVELGIDEISAHLVKDLARLEPFGPGHEKPVFRMSNARIHSYKVMKDAHVRWTFTGSGAGNKKVSVQGISFNYMGKWNEATPEELFALQEKSGLLVQFTLSVNRFNGNESIQLMVDRLIPGQFN